MADAQRATSAQLLALADLLDGGVHGINLCDSVLMRSAHALLQECPMTALIPFGVTVWPLSGALAPAPMLGSVSEGVSQWVSTVSGAGLHWYVADDSPAARDHNSFSVKAAYANGCLLHTLRDDDVSVVGGEGVVGVDVRVVGPGEAEVRYRVASGTTGTVSLSVAVLGTALGQGTWTIEVRRGMVVL